MPVRIRASNSMPSLHPDNPKTSNHSKQSSGSSAKRLSKQRSLKNIFSLLSPSSSSSSSSSGASGNGNKLRHSGDVMAMSNPNDSETNPKKLSSSQSCGDIPSQQTRISRSSTLSKLIKGRKDSLLSKKDKFKMPSPFEPPVKITEALNISGGPSTPGAMWIDETDAVTTSSTSPPSAQQDEKPTLVRTWSRPSGKGKLLHSRTSAPQLMSDIKKLQLDLSPTLPKIGTHHWWGSANPKPPDNSNALLQQQLDADTSPNLIVNNNLATTSLNRSISEFHLQRKPSKWVMAAPSTPPSNGATGSHNGSPVRGISSSPLSSSPETRGCTAGSSPVSSIIRIYFVPLVFEEVTGGSFPDDEGDQPTHTAAAMDSQTHADPLNASSLCLNSCQLWTNYWTQVVTSTTMAKDIIKYLAPKIDRNEQLLKLCSTPNIYDYVEDDTLLIGLRSKKIYLMEMPNEVVVHESETLPDLRGLVAETPRPKPASLTSSMLSISRSWSPSYYCRFLSGSQQQSGHSGNQPLSTMCASPDSSRDDPFLLTPRSSEGGNTFSYSSCSSYSSPLMMSCTELSTKGGGSGGGGGSSKSNDSVEISSKCKERIKILDNYFHHYYQELNSYLAQRTRRMDNLLEALRESGIKEHSIAWQRCLREYMDKESTYLRQKRAHIGSSDFRKLSIIGKGGFGTVYLATKKDTNEIVTLKVIRKTAYHRANQMTSVSKEKAVMMIPTTTRDDANQWITRLLYSFEDSHYLYLAMEYHCGGDFRSLLTNLVTLSDDMSSFYFAEMVLAIESLHKLGYIHRDIKPSNFVIDRCGHMKLIDFGLSKDGFLSHNSKYYSTWKNLLNSKDDSHPKIPRFKSGKKLVKHVTYAKVGSPEYMAPEMLAGKGYDMTYDYWSLGVVLFEMLFGETPFAAETVEEVFKNIMDWKKVLDWDYLGQYFSPVAKDLLQKLLCEPERRLTSQELKAHPYFADIDWDNIKNITPPFIPQVKSESDASYFSDAMDIIDEDANNDVHLEGDYDEAVEVATQQPPASPAAAAVPVTPDTSHHPDTTVDDIDSFRSMPFGGFTFQRFPSVVEGARAKGLIKSFYVEEKSLSRAASNSSLNSPSTGGLGLGGLGGPGGPGGSPIIQSDISGSGGRVPMIQVPSGSSPQSYTPPQMSPPATSYKQHSPLPILRMPSLRSNNNNKNK
ncbi:hypothetical protein SAMD00019534_106040 [Acytostelium subglobosum LB1]|uniref:hypothetical protein n=1 Tax=Acytostelium subglobosum LB1 TaxID=1410327 RepID=UPI0006447F18|nr:hypothetical protein SAMD00019534_106040 [Acytostelium subglobosum LB1]GAM27428.1 hypothetical protein SAMD00019534_106040 [Acytostelium subglobosum LB1]|eukprot:XP_012749493.1 hypothetical protein SAMD00019534_106040 [Acytostelium subglobosum LB1]